MLTVCDLASGPALRCTKLAILLILISDRFENGQWTLELTMEASWVWAVGLGSSAMIRTQKMTKRWLETGD